MINVAIWGYELNVILILLIIRCIFPFELGYIYKHKCILFNVGKKHAFGLVFFLAFIIWFTWQILVKNESFQCILINKHLMASQLVLCSDCCIMFYRSSELWCGQSSGRLTVWNLHSTKGSLKRMCHDNKDGLAQDVTLISICPGDNTAVWTYASPGMDYLYSTACLNWPQWAVHKLFFEIRLYIVQRISLTC